MKAKWFIVFACICALVAILPAQSELPAITREAINRGLFRPSSSVMLYGTRAQATQLRGNPYLDSAWAAATLWFFPEVLARFGLPTDTCIGGYPGRFNLYEQTIELRDADTIRRVGGHTLRRLSLQRVGDTLWLVHPTYFGLSATAFRGFFEVLTDGPRLALLRHTTVEVQSPNYVIALDVGSRHPILFQRSHYYWYDHRRQQLLPARFKRRAVLQLLRPEQRRIEQFVKLEKLSWRKPEDVRQIIRFYNALPPTYRT